MRAVAKKMTNLLGAALIAATCVACSERTEDKMEKQADKAGDKAEQAADATGNAVANGGRAAETLDVKTALMLDKRVDASNINVDSDHLTKTVTLKGHVPTAEQKTVAGQIAVAKAVGYQVRNELTIGR